MMTVTDQFMCSDDEGNRYAIVEYTNMITERPLSDRSTSIPGAKDYKTLDGLPVNFVDENTFQIVKSNTVVRRLG